jgi:hypothetical protein
MRTIPRFAGSGENPCQRHISARAWHIDCPRCKRAKNTLLSDALIRTTTVQFGRTIRRHKQQWCAGL